MPSHYSQYQHRKIFNMNWLEFTKWAIKYIFKKFDYEPCNLCFTVLLRLFLQEIHMLFFFISNLLRPNMWFRSCTTWTQHTSLAASKLAQILFHGTNPLIIVGCYCDISTFYKKFLNAHFTCNYSVIQVTYHSWSDIDSQATL